MDYIKEYKSFVNGYYLSEGIRITTGILLPALVLNHFGNLPAGIIVSIGAMCVSTTDTAGPIHHRRNGMLACCGIIFIVSLLTGLAADSTIVFGIFIFIFCFLFSMINVYGNRAGSIGISALLMMVLSIDHHYAAGQVLLNSLYVLCGGIWYTVLSLLLYGFRPYKLAQQALGDCIQATADYLLIKIAFYDKKVDYEKSYQQLREQQSIVQEKQNLVRELLFKSRDITRESTPTGRILVMIFLDIVDLFERVVTAPQDYESLHSFFDNTDILQRYRSLLFSIVKELDSIGIAVKSGKASEENPSLPTAIKKLKEDFVRFRDENRTAENVEGFISLRQILDIIEDIGDRLHTLHRYTTYDDALSKDTNRTVDYEKFITHQDMDPNLLVDNFTMQSNVFRYSIRVSVATLTGYIISKFFPFGHSYWTLLTIIVILKPAYGLTKKRNYQRLLGTFAGAAIGLTVLYFVKAKNALFLFMIVFMVGAYSFMRTRYLVFVVLLTPYILLLFYLLNPHDFKAILADRVVDTAIGSGIAFLANSIITPVWENEQITLYMIKSIEDNTCYFIDVTGVLSGEKISLTQFKLSRKKAFVSLANLSDAFNRVLSEPKSKQKNIRWLHQFVVTSHMLTSHIATLSYYSPSLMELKEDDGFLPAIEAIRLKLDNCVAILQQKAGYNDPNLNKEGIRMLNDELNGLIEKRKSELQQGTTESGTRKKLSLFKPVADQLTFISKAAADMEKICLRMQMETKNAV